MSSAFEQAFEQLVEGANPDDVEEIKSLHLFSIYRKRFSEVLERRPFSTPAKLFNEHRKVLQSFPESFKVVGASIYNFSVLPTEFMQLWVDVNGSTFAVPRSLSGVIRTSIDAKTMLFWSDFMMRCDTETDPREIYGAMDGKLELVDHADFDAAVTQHKIESKQARAMQRNYREAANLPPIEYDFKQAAVWESVLCELQTQCSPEFAMDIYITNCILMDPRSFRTNEDGNLECWKSILSEKEDYNCVVGDTKKQPSIFVPTDVVKVFGPTGKITWDDVKFLYLFADASKRSKLNRSATNKLFGYDTSELDWALVEEFATNYESPIDEIRRVYPQAKNHPFVWNMIVENGSNFETQSQLAKFYQRCTGEELSKPDTTLLFDHFRAPGDDTVLPSAEEFWARMSIDKVPSTKDQYVWWSLAPNLPSDPRSVYNSIQSTRAEIDTRWQPTSAFEDLTDAAQAAYSVNFSSCQLRAQEESEMGDRCREKLYGMINEPMKELSQPEQFAWVMVAQSLEKSNKQPPAVVYATHLFGVDRLLCSLESSTEYNYLKEHGNKLAHQTNVPSKKRTADEARLPTMEEQLACNRQTFGSKPRSK